MPGGYEVASPGDLGELFRVIDQIQRDIAELGRASGTQTAQAVKKLQDLVDGLISQVNGIFTGYVQAGGNITSTGGRGTFATGLSSVGASTTDLTALSGLRQITYQLYSGANVGLFGYAPSTIHSKTNLSTSLPFSASDVFKVIPYMYEYIGQVAIRDDPENENYDPDYIVPMEIGLMAEHLIEHRMRTFVVFNEDGTPKTIDYAAFGAIANLVAVRDLNERLQAAGF